MKLHRAFEVVELLVLIAVLLTSMGAETSAQQESQKPGNQEKKSESLEQYPEVRDAIREFMSRGEYEKVRSYLENHLKKHADDIHSRVYLGHVLMLTNHWEEAGDLLETCLNNTDVGDFQVLNMIADARIQQAENAEFVVGSDGILTHARYSPEQVAAIQKKNQNLAIDAFKRALAIRPDSLKTKYRLGQLLLRSEQYSDALPLFESIHKQAPEIPSGVLMYCQTLTKLKRYEDALEIANSSIKNRPNDVELMKVLIQCHQQLKNTTEADRYSERMAFYKDLPGFITLEPTEENKSDLKSLHESKTVDRLCKDKSQRASELLAILCWHHPHNALEDKAFDELQSRGQVVTPIAEGLLDDANSCCTIRGAFRILATVKAPNTLERLAEYLPQDHRQFGFDMDVAGSMEILGDERAVPHLIDVLAPDQHDVKADQSTIEMLQSTTPGRIRAALALGAFDTKESKEALQKSLSHPQLRIFSTASLYRLTTAEKYLPELKKAIVGDDKYDAYQVAQALKKTPGAAAKNLVELYDSRQRSK